MQHSLVLFLQIVGFVAAVAFALVTTMISIEAPAEAKSSNFIALLSFYERPGSNANVSCGRAQPLLTDSLASLSQSSLALLCSSIAAVAETKLRSYTENYTSFAFPPGCKPAGFNATYSHMGHSSHVDNRPNSRMCLGGFDLPSFVNFTEESYKWN